MFDSDGGVVYVDVDMVVNVDVDAEVAVEFDDVEEESNLKVQLDTQKNEENLIRRLL